MRLNPSSEIPGSWLDLRLMPLVSNPSEKKPAPLNYLRTSLQTWSGRRCILTLRTKEILEINDVGEHCIFFE